MLLIQYSRSAYFTNENMHQMTEFSGHFRTLCTEYTFSRLAQCDNIENSCMHIFTMLQVTGRSNKQEVGFMLVSVETEQTPSVDLV